MQLRWQTLTYFPNEANPKVSPVKNRKSQSTNNKPIEEVTLNVLREVVINLKCTKASSPVKKRKSQRANNKPLEEHTLNVRSEVVINLKCNLGGKP